MYRCLFLLLAAAAVGLPPAARADAFDNYTNPILRKVPAAEGTREIKQLTPALIADNDRVLPDIAPAFVVVQTNQGRYSKLLVQAARQKVSADRVVPILLIARYVTYNEGTDESVLASGKNVYLFPGFRLSLDLGQVVPEELGGDLRFVADGDRVYTEPLGKAKLFLVTRPLPEASPKKTPKFVIGDKFEPRYFNGTFRLYDDGRRSGKLTLNVEEGGTVAGAFTSDKDGEKYDVTGKIGTPQHAIQFTIKYPRTEETFQGWLFTGDGKALAGSSRMLDHEAGFYAVRVEEE
jgi:hypothetical protein